MSWLRANPAAVLDLEVHPGGCFWMKRDASVLRHPRWSRGYSALFASAVQRLCLQASRKLGRLERLDGRTLRCSDAAPCSFPMQQFLTNGPFLVFFGRATTMGLALEAGLRGDQIVCGRRAFPFEAKRLWLPRMMWSSFTVRRPWFPSGWGRPAGV